MTLVLSQCYGFVSILLNRQGFSEIMNMDLPAMQGSGLCQNGIVSINMEASKDDFRASYLGEFVKNKQSG